MIILRVSPNLTRVLVVKWTRIKLYLQVEILQVSEALEDVIRKWTEPTTVQMKCIEPTQPVKGVFSQGAQVAVVSQIQLLEQREAVKGGGLDVRDVVGVDPEGDRFWAEVTPK